jgi:hypothetical protein
VAPIARPKGGWHQLQKVGGTNCNLPKAPPTPQNSNRGRKVGGTNCKKWVAPIANYSKSPDTPELQSRPKGEWHQLQKVGGTNCKLPKVPRHPRTPIAAERWVAPITKSGWHQFQLTQSPPTPQFAAERWVAPIANYPKSPDTPELQSRPKGEWHQLQKVGGTNCNLPKVPRHPRTPIAAERWVAPISDFGKCYLRKNGRRDLGKSRLGKCPRKEEDRERR